MSSTHCATSQTTLCPSTDGEDYGASSGAVLSEGRLVTIIYRFLGQDPVVAWLLVVAVVVNVALLIVTLQGYVRRRRAAKRGRVSERRV